MARMADLLRPGTESVADAGLVAFAYEVGVSLPKAKELLQTYGAGWIYARGGNVVVTDSPDARKRMARRMKVCVILEEDGSVGYLTAKNVKQADLRVKRGKARNIMRRERAEYFAEMREHRESLRRERMFNAGKGTRSVKRGGKGDGPGDLGKYVNRPVPKMANMEPKAVTTFVKINMTITVD